VWPQSAPTNPKDACQISCGVLDLACNILQFCLDVTKLSAVAAAKITALLQEIVVVIL